jgi:predicted dehydrogenase
MKTWIIGAGAIAIEYAKILTELGHELTIIGRGEESAQKFFEETGIKAISGGVENYCASTNQIPDAAIIAVSVDQLFEATVEVIKKGCKKILVEKPGAVSFSQIEQLEKISKENGAKVFIAYNRRFYPSVRKTIKLIEEDGGLKSFHFEFTEWAFKIEPLPIPDPVKKNWFFANSTHVVDLAFYVGGNPIDFCTYTQGGLNWHSPSSFVGAGFTEKKALFTYKANWDAPGRWGVEFLTSKRKIILQPLEGIKILKLGTVSIEDFDFVMNPIELRYKPGFYEQVIDFFSNSPKAKTLTEQKNNIQNIYSKIISGKFLE